MGMRGSSFIRRHSFPRRFSSKNSLRNYVSEVMARGMSVCRTYGLSSKEDGTFSDSDDGGRASGLDMVHADGDKHHKSFEADMNTSIARKEQGWKL
jgi:hypothetical protein